MAIKVIVVGLGRRGHDWVRELRMSSAFELVGCVDVIGQRLIAFQI
jgi:hypothetical protein